MKKFQFNKQYVTIGIYAFGVAIVSLIFGLVVFRIGSILGFFGNALSAIKAVPYGIAIALALYPFINLASSGYSRLFEKKRPRPRLVSALSLVTVYLGLLLVIAILVIGIIPPMISTFGEMVQLVSSSVGGIRESLSGIFSSSEFLQKMADSAIEYIGNTLSGLISSDVAEIAAALVTGIVGEAFDLLVGLIISIYLLAGRRILSSIFGKLVAATLPTGGALRFSMFIKRLYSNLTEFIAARILSALFLGIASYLLFWAFGTPFYPLLSLIIVVFNLFPVFGTLISFFVCGIVLLVTTPSHILPVLGILTLLEIADNLLIEPRTLPHKALRPNVGATIVLMLLGYAIFGFWGTLVAIPLWATIQNALRAFSVHLLNKRGLPTALEDYADFDIRKHMKAEEKPATETEAAAAAPAAEEPFAEPAAAVPLVDDADTPGSI